MNMFATKSVFFKKMCVALVISMLLLLNDLALADDINRCAYYDFDAQSLHIPCFIVGQKWEHHWLELRSSDDGRFELSSFGSYNQDESDAVIKEDKCGYLNGSTSTIELPCVETGDSVFWVDLLFSEDYSTFTISDFDKTGFTDTDSENSSCSQENLDSCQSVKGCVDAQGFWRDGRCLAQRPENEIFTSGHDPEKLVSVLQSDDLPDIKFPVNQLMIHTPDHISSSEIRNVILTMENIRLIGQAPHSGFYQLEVDAVTVEELARIKSELVQLPQIKGASYNFIMPRRTDIGRCPVEPDVSFLPANDKLVYEQTDYFVALEIIQGIREDITLHPVTVGIYESGYFASCGEFDDITIDNYSQIRPDGIREPLMIDPAGDSSDIAISRHGNYVAGLIAADNDGSGINGLASSLLGDSLRVVMADSIIGIDSEASISNAIGAIENMIIEGGADIINSSFGLGFYREDEGQAFLDDAIDAFRDFMDGHPDVLFVNAAGNRRIKLTGSNELPAGIDLPNTLTVSYWSHDDPAVLGRSAYGDLVDISAPGDMIPVVTVDGQVGHTRGTSLATPIVVSAAALLKSVGGRDLSAPEIKSLLLNHTLHGERTEPQGGIQLSFSFPLMDLLWEKYQNTTWGEYTFDWDRDGMHDVPVAVAITVCNGVDITLSEFGAFTIDPSIVCAPGDGAMFMTSDGKSWYVVAYGLNGSEDVLVMSVSGETPFSLNTDYLMGSQASAVVAVLDGDLIDRSQCRYLDPEDGDFYYAGHTFSGTLRFTSCDITERDEKGRPKYLAVDLYFKSDVEGYQTLYYPSDDLLPIVIDEKPTHINGELTNIMVLTLEPLGVYGEYVEKACLSSSSPD